MSATRGAGFWLAAVATVVIVAAVAAAFLEMGSPAEQRATQLDARRVQDLQRLAAGIEAHARVHGALPPTLATLSAQPGSRWPVTDPATDTPYEYETTGERSYRLCAVFMTDTASAKDGAMPWGGDAWSHAVGRRCFDRRLKYEEP